MDLNDEEKKKTNRRVRFASPPPPNVKKLTTNEKQLKRLLVKRWRLWNNFLIYSSSFSLFLFVPLMKKIIGLFKDGIDDSPDRQTFEFFFHFCSFIFCVAIRPIWHVQFTTAPLSSPTNISVFHFSSSFSYFCSLLPPEFDKKTKQMKVDFLFFRFNFLFFFCFPLIFSFLSFGPGTFLQRKKKKILAST